MKDSCLFASFYEAIKHKLDDQSIKILRWRSVELLSPHLIYFVFVPLCVAVRNVRLSGPRMMKSWFYQKANS